MSKKTVLGKLTVIGVLYGVFWLLHLMFHGISLYFLFGLACIFFFFFWVYSRRVQGPNAKEMQQDHVRGMATILLPVLFLASMLVMKDYQQPAGNNPYFTNIDHHALSNTGVAFRDALDLYTAEDNSARGIWDSEGGTLSLSGSSTGSAELIFRNFGQPVLAVQDKKIRLLNPVFDTFLLDGFTIRDAQSTTTLTWQKVRSERKKSGPIFSFELVVSTSDPLLVNNAITQGNLYTDTVVITNVTMRKGLDLKALVRKAVLTRGTTMELLLGWADRYPGTAVIMDDPDADVPQLHFFPAPALIRNALFKHRGNPMLPHTTSTRPISEEQQFYVGLENSRRLKQVRALTDAEKVLAPNATHLLVLDEIAYLPMKAATYDAHPVGKAEVRFLKNTYKQIGVNDIREGFLIHDDVKDNDYTRFDALIEYNSGPATAPLSYKVYGVKNAGAVLKQGNSFSIQSGNKALTWMFAIHNFSANKYSFAHITVYLAILILLMLYLLLFAPGANLVYIETPLLMTAYLLMTYRLLLLWRIATFPPLENISKTEFDTLQKFDLKLGIVLPFPISWAAAIGVLIAILFYRTLGPDKVGSKVRRLLSLLFGWIPRLANTKWKGMVSFCSRPLLLHMIVLVVCGTAFKFNLLPEWLIRIATILVPVLSYFVCCYYLLQQGDQIVYPHKSYRFRFQQIISSYLKQLISTRIFFASACTLIFLFIVDRGFGVLFLLFLLFKNVLFPFTNQKSLVRTQRPLDKIFNAGTLHRFTCLMIYLIAIAYKPAFHHLVKSKVGVLLLGFLAVLGTLYLLHTWNKKVRSVLALLAVVAVVVYTVPFTYNGIDNFLEEKIRLVKYRTQILTTPVEQMLFEGRYSSSQEQKIIETAQNQWFINSYLHAAQDVPPDLSHHPMQLLEHFNKGVDYSTQTRDVVLPRFVIGEFGNFTMWLLLALFAVPLALFFFSYKLTTDNGRVHTGSYIGAMGLTLLLTLALFVWLTATNRFVFFGQDFPFLSLTSRLSTFLPLCLIAAVLLCIPQIRTRTNLMMDQKRMIRIGIFTVVILVVIGISGRSNLLSESNFRVDFSRVQGRIDEVSEIFDRVQSSGKVPVNLTAGLLDSNPQKFMQGVKHLFKALYEDKRFAELMKDATLYERSILDTLRVNPAVGFQISSPLHLQYDAGEDRLKMAFNKYWRMELPAYNLREVWKGDILQQPLEAISIGQTAILHQTAGNAEVIAVPASYFAPGTGSIGLLRFNVSKGPTSQCYVFNKKTKEILPYRKGQATAMLKGDDLVLFINDQNSVSTWAMQGPDQRYFAYSFLVNGRQKHIYPLGSDFFWARHWAQATKYHFEQTRAFNEPDTIALDFDLNKKVNSYLYRALKPMKAGQGNLTFSVIAADGVGNLRLLADYADQRDRLDPNNDQAIAEKEQEQYFNINTRGERLQWGNLNLLRMDLGPGSSIKPLVAAAVASQLNAGWEHMRLEPGQLGVNSKGKKVIADYAGLHLGRTGWKVEDTGNNRTTDLITYLSKSNNLYHSLFMFLGSYEKNAFYTNGMLSWDNVLSTQPPIDAARFPVLSVGTGLRYLREPKEWPRTNSNLSKYEKPTYFGSTTSLLANGLNQNFDLLVEPSTNLGTGNPDKYLFSSLLAESVMNRRIWAFPEASYFFQGKRTSSEIIENFNRGIRFPTQGGDPYVLTPLKMVEMLGKMASLNPLYNVSIDHPRSKTVALNFDQASWGNRTNYENFLVHQVFEGMQQVLINGTGQRLTGGKSQYESYYLYAKTGTIGNSDNNNSKRLALIISKKPFTPGGFSGQKFYVVYFTVGNAFESNAAGSEKDWFWEKYKYVLDEIISSASFNKYMNSVP